jgi:RimJ/RimL family protein N-acetyltransferase
MFCTRIPRFIEDGDIRLRPLRIIDANFLLKRFKNEGILFNSFRHKTPVPVLLSFWWWIKKTFIPAYCIECDSRQIGFIGLYNLIPGKSAEMSLVIFDKNNRRMGYGTRAFNICVKGMQRHFVVKEIIVRVKTDNYGALSFWKKLGFVETGIINGLITMSMGL